MSVDRAINVLYPVRFMSLSRPLFLLRITALIYLVVAVVACEQIFRTMAYKPEVAAAAAEAATHMSGTVGNITSNTTSKPVILVASSCVFSNALQAAYNLIAIVQRTVSFAMIVTANVFIIRKLFNSKRNLSRAKKSGNAVAAQQNENNNNSNSKSTAYLSRKEYAFAFSLMANNVIYFVLIMPFFVVQFVQLYSNLAPGQSASFVSYTALLYNITILGNYVFDSLPFYINLAFNRLFRSELHAIAVGLLARIDIRRTSTGDSSTTGANTTGKSVSSKGRTAVTRQN